MCIDDFVLQQVASENRKNLTWTPSAVTQINGESATEFVIAFAKKNVDGLIDPMADWNGAFFSKPRALGGGLPSPFAATLVYPGRDTMELVFANGTTEIGNWTAVCQLNMTGITSGEDFYDAFVFVPEGYEPEAAPVTTETVEDASSVKTALELGVPYPHPVIVQEGLGSGGFGSGYFIQDSKIAVLSIPSFFMPGSFAESFQDLVTSFLKKSKDAGMEKLVIDLQGNGGGVVMLGIDLFKQVEFPSTRPAC